MTIYVHCTQSSKISHPAYMWHSLAIFDLPLPYFILCYYVPSMSDSHPTKLPRILHDVHLPMVHLLYLCQNSFLLAKILVILFYTHLETTCWPFTIRSKVPCHVLMHILRTLHFCGYTRRWCHL